MEKALLCAGVDVSLGEVLLPVDQLTEYAWRFRYPNDLAEPEFDQATDTLRLAAAVVVEKTRKRRSLLPEWPEW